MDYKNFGMYVCRKDGKRVKLTISENDYTAQVMDDDSVTILEDVTDTDLAYIAADLGRSMMKYSEVLDSSRYERGIMYEFAPDIAEDHVKDLVTGEVFTYEEGVKREVEQRKKFIDKLQQEIIELEAELGQ